LKIVCFRYVNEDFDDESLNELNKELLMKLHESGVAAPSYTAIDGKYSLRVAITNHHSRREDFDILVGELLRLGHNLIYRSKARRDIGPLTAHTHLLSITIPYSELLEM